MVNGVDEVTINPAVNESNATVEYLDSSDAEIPDADGAKTGQQVSLTEGANTIKVKVTAQDATTTDTYTVVVTRNTAPTAADKTVTTAQDAAYTFNAADFGFADTDTGDVLASVRIESVPALGELALDGTAVSLNDVIPSADIDDNKLTFTPVAGASGDNYASFMFKVNDGTDFSADANTITFNVRDLSCAAPSFGTRRNHWSGTVTVGGDDIIGYGFASGTGSLDPNVFSIGSNSYTIDLVTVGADAATRGALSLNLTSSNLTSAEAAALKLHVCDSAGFDFDGNDVDHQDADFSYAWAAAALDWSPPVATRTLYLSLPANQAATGEPTITGTAQVGQALTADASPITDADGLPSTFTYQWIRVDADGTSNEEDISGEIAATYTLTTADVGKKVKVKVSFTDDLSSDEERTSEAYPASATVTAANTATAQGDVWTGTVTVGEIRDFNGFGYVAAPHPLAPTGGSLSDDDFDIDGTTYTVWRITIGTTGTNEARPRFTVATGSPPAVTDLPNKDELVLRLTYGGVIGNFALLDATYTGSGPSSSQGFFWGTRHPTGDYPSRGQTMTVELLFKIAPTAANNTVLTPRNTAYTFTASEFGFADTNAGDTLASVRIVTLPAEGTLALDGTAVTPDQVVTRADIDDKKLIFTPVAGASGDGYASFTFKVNDGIVDSDDAYTMTIDVTVALVAPGPPTGLAATAGGQSRIDLAWTAPANTGGSPITGYRIEVSPDGTSDWTDLVADTASTATTYAHTGLDAATTRHYRVSAINAVGTSVPSGSDDATTETAIPAGVIRVPLDSVLKPADIGAGERFRLMFFSSTVRDATSTDIADYNTLVRTLAAAGLTAIQTYAGDFTALVSTESVNARANTQTRATDTDAPIYWVDSRQYRCEPTGGRWLRGLL